MAYTPTADQLAEKFEFVTSRALRLKEGYAFVTSTLDDGIADGVGGDVSLVADTLTIPFTYENAYAYTDLSPTGVLSGSTGHTLVDLTHYTEVQFLHWASTAGATGSVIRAQYSLDGSTYVDLSNTVPFDDTTLHASGWSTIPEAARTLVTLLPFALGGDSDADPVTGAASIMFRR